MIFPLCAVLGCLFFASESTLARRRHSSMATDARATDGGTLRVLWMFSLASIAAGLAVTYWPLDPHLPKGFPWRAASLATFVAGTALRWWAIIHLGRFFTVDIAVARDQRVVDDGPYRLVRHPSYTGLLMQYTGWALSLNNMVALPVVLVPVFISLAYRMRMEETSLTHALGDAYSAYCRRTKRLVPAVY